MTNFIITNEKNSEEYKRQFSDTTEARHFIINHLDLSLNWKIKEIKEILKFEVGKTYSCRSVCNYDCIFSFKIEKRTEKTVWISGRMIKGSIAKRVGVYDKLEMIDPLGKYSMSPVLRAI